MLKDGLPVGEQPIVFVGGKGGVGKTTIASALGYHFGGRGERTLLVSTDPAHSLGDLFDRHIGDDETELLPGLAALEIDPEREVDRYLRSVKQNLRELVRPEMYGDIDSQLELTRMSPGAQEAALLERTSRIMIEAPKRFDRLIFDTAPTGSTLRLLSLPEVMTAWMEGLLERRERAESFRESLRGVWRREPGEADGEGEGESHGAEGSPGRREAARARKIREVLTDRRRRFSRARRLLTDPDQCAFVLVVLAEKLPILEGHRAYRALVSAGVPVTAVVVNRILPRGSLGEFLEHRREQEAEYLEEIERRFTDLRRIRVPLLAEDVGSVDGVSAVADYLSRGGVA